MIDLKTPVLRFDTHETTYFVHDEQGLLIGTYDGTTGDPNDERICREDPSRLFLCSGPSVRRFRDLMVLGLFTEKAREAPSFRVVRKALPYYRYA